MKPSKTLKFSEIDKHNKENDCWVVYKDKVLNVTDFLSDHPGGLDVIMDLAGKDITQAFEDIGHSEDALEMMNKFLIGKVEKEQKESEKRVKSQEKTKPASADQIKSKPAAANGTFQALLPVLAIVIAIIAYLFLNK